MRKSAAVMIGTLLLAVSAFAQNNGGGTNTNPSDPNDPNSQNGDREARNGYWEANLAGGNYMVALGRISSVSRHKYVLDGAVIVDEVTVDTTGQALARFYFITPINAEGGPGAAVTQAAERAAALVDGAARRSGTDVQDMVMKKYPLTTHAKSIEYRLLSEQQLSALYSSVRTAWVSGKGRVFTSR